MILIFYYKTITKKLRVLYYFVFLRVMELFSDACNSPRALSDFFETRIRSVHSIEEALNGKADSFFDDPEWMKSIASL